VALFLLPGRKFMNLTLILDCFRTIVLYLSRPLWGRFGAEFYKNGANLMIAAEYQNSEMP
jgi:hypothetical protein